MVKKIILFSVLILLAGTGGFLLSSFCRYKQDLDIRKRADAVDNANNRLESTISSLSNELAIIGITAHNFEQSNRKLAKQLSVINTASGYFNQSISNATTSANGIDDLLGTIQERSREENKTIGR